MKVPNIEELEGEENEASIAYETLEIDFQLSDEAAYSRWVNQIAEREQKTIGSLVYIFCNDDYLLKLNVEHLQHDTLTDIITFPYEDDPIEGDIFISIDRVRENAEEFKVAFENELHRVMSHGVLHLCGYKDKTETERALMRTKEDSALALWGELNA